VTPAHVLRKADVPAAGAAIGVRVPPKTRSAADLLELHGPWSVAVATGLLQISDGKVTGGQALEGWPPGDAALLDAWLAGTACRGPGRGRNQGREDGLTGVAGVRAGTAQGPGAGGSAGGQRAMACGAGRVRRSL